MPLWFQGFFAIFIVKQIKVYLYQFGIRIYYEKELDCVEVFFAKKALLQ